MKVIVGLVFVISGTAFAQTNLGTITFTNNSGIVITNAEVVKVQANGLIYRIPEGGGTVKFSDLPQDVRARFGYDAEKAAAADAAERQLQAEAYAREVALYKAEHWRGPTREIHELSITNDLIYPKCSVTVEGRQREILISNLPAETQKYFDDLGKLQAAVEAATAQVEADQSAVSNADKTIPTRSRSRLVRIERAQVNQARQRVSAEQKQLSKMKSDLSAMKRQEPEKATITAFQTAQKYNNLEIWDCSAK